MSQGPKPKTLEDVASELEHLHIVATQAAEELVAIRRLLEVALGPPSARPAADLEDEELADF